MRPNYFCTVAQERFWTREVQKKRGGGAENIKYKSFCHQIWQASASTGNFNGNRVLHNSRHLTWTEWSGGKTSSRRKQRGLGAKPPALGAFWGFITKIIHFRHVSAEILPKNLPNIFIIVHFCIKCIILAIILFKY